MNPDRTPIPREQLPPGWSPAERADDRFSYSCARPSIDLLAVRTPADNSHPSLGLGQCWELRYRFSIGELPVSEAFGCVSTRSAAARGLLACMHRIHEEIDESDDLLELESVLREVRLGDLVPDLNPPQ
jgi:hypothetical protein